MSNTVSQESKAMFRKVIIGVSTAVLTSAIIYFLGFNSSGSKASELEIKKNTIATWKTYVKAENDLQPKHDSSLARLLRNELDMPGYRRLDSGYSAEFIDYVSKLSATKDIDKELALLLRERSEYKKQELANFFNYYDRFTALKDSNADITTKNSLITELNESLNSKRTNFVERVGRSIEDMASSLARKYKYPFSITDFRFNPYYQAIRASHRKSELPE